jgi:branched-chain amino acid transport system substrate-binding protein
MVDKLIKIRGVHMKGKNVWTVGIGVVSIFLLAGFVLTTALVKDSDAAPAKKLTIGMIACLTGFFSPNDVPAAHEALMTADMINEKGGITVKGEKYQLEVLIEDAKSTLDGVTAAANRLVFDKGVKLILGPAGFFSAASSPVTTPNNVLNIISFSTGQPGEIDKTTPFTFQAYDGTAASFIAGVNYIKAHFPKVKKVAIVTADDGSAPFLKPVFLKALESAGMSMAGDMVLFPNETQDFSPIAAKLNAIKDADAIGVGLGLPNHVGAMIKGLRELGNKKLFFMGVVCPFSVVVKIAGPEAAENVLINSITPNDPANPRLMNDISKRLIAKYGESTPIMLQSANSIWVLKQVIEAAQSIDATAIKAKWETMDKAETFFGPGIMCGDATTGLKHHVVTHPLPFQTLKNGKIVSAGFSGQVVLP